MVTGNKHLFLGLGGSVVKLYFKFGGLFRMSLKKHVPKGRQGTNKQNAMTMKQIYSAPWGHLQDTIL